MVSQNSSTATMERGATRKSLIPRHAGVKKEAMYFATGVENSNPTINNGQTRIDELESCGHYKQWSTDFDKVQEIGLQFLRYGPPIHKTFLGPGKYDWEFTDTVFADLQKRKIIPIVDLCHFGLPDWMGNFQNPDFPKLFSEYATAFAERFPWVQLYTPVNEMFICAVFSALYGWWNEQLTTERGYVTALKNICKANIFAMDAILKVRDDAIFIQSESSEHFHPTSPQGIKFAHLKNAERFITLDLNYAHPVDSEMYQFLMDNGMTREEYDFFMNQRLRYSCIMGNDYYFTNEHYVTANREILPSGEIFGYGEITTQYYDRYHLPVMHTETNIKEGPNGDEAVSWLHKQWTEILQARAHAVPVVGFTWYSLTDQIDWDTALREQNNRVNAVGLYDLDRQIRAVGKAYKKLVEEWSRYLSSVTVCLTVPIVFPQ